MRLADDRDRVVAEESGQRDRIVGLFHAFEFLSDLAVVAVEPVELGWEVARATMTSSRR
ncbi:hypothetical protein ACN28C_19690 [Plantactinospora sp. WMMC1484]|uniref:hypothetical protein n=1 Tax=Plantactinospora sp. WMMC1484 TaxID=3404122 RepID=UPI003BF55482